MSVSRRFLIAPSLSRLIRKECGSFQVVEGHFPPQFDRQSHVRIENGQAHLILTDLDASPEVAEDQTSLPIAHAEALLQFCPGTVTFARSVVSLAPTNAFIDRFISPGPLDLVTVQFTTSADAATFSAPIWFGAEVSEENAYSNPAIALSGLPPTQVTEVSNQALEAVLDMVEGAFSYPTSIQVESGPEADKDSGLAGLGEVARVENLPTASGLPRRVDAHQNGDASRDEQMASLVQNLSATLAQSTSAANGSGVAANPRRGWRSARY